MGIEFVGVLFLFLVFVCLIVAGSEPEGAAAPKQGADFVSAVWQYAEKNDWVVEEHALEWVSCRGRKGDLTVEVNARRVGAHQHCTVSVWPCPNPALVGKALPMFASVSSGRLVLQLHHGDLGQTVAGLVEDVSRWSASLSARWDAIAEAEGIVVSSRRVSSRTGRVVVSGVCRGVPFTVAWPAPSSPMVVTAGMRERLPGQIIARGRVHQGKLVPRFDPILGSVADVYGSAPDRLRAVLSADAVREPLVEVMHRFPDATVTRDVVSLVAQDGAGADAVGLVRLACELAGALSAQLAATAARSVRPPRGAQSEASRR